ncbi:MAG: hypothetical protein L3J21_05125 [Devosiaceae bacterium]|nr:hypothetical protein [Devosiaceae bacterium]
MFGSREFSKPNLLHGLIGRATGNDLRVLVVPGPELALAGGLDLMDAGLRMASGPRDANVLLLLPPLGDKMLNAASVAFAQMPRPRAIVALGVKNISPLPEADIYGELSQAGLIESVNSLRLHFAQNSFSNSVQSFDAPALQSRIEYTCPMHPEVVSNQPGSCPKCGMDLVPRETGTDTGQPEEKSVQKTQSSSNAAHAHSSHVKTAPAEVDHGEHKKADGESGDATAKYTCPMHPEVVSDEPGSCPKCGMFLEPVKAESDHGSHSHGSHSHESESSVSKLIGLEPGFMSMIEMTEGTPRSSDGLQMEWITVPFGPFFPGLPAGFGLELTLDGDNVAKATTSSFCGFSDSLENGPINAGDYVENLQGQMPLAPLTYRLLACRAIEAAAEKTSENDNLRDATLAQERIASQLRWLTNLGRQLGLKGIERKAAKLQLLIIGADYEQIIKLTPELSQFIKKVKATPFLRRRLDAVGELPPQSNWDGPQSIENNAAGRLVARLDDISQSLALIKKAGAIGEIKLAEIGNAAGHGHASVDTARGKANLHVELKGGQVISAKLDTPSMRHTELVAPLTDQQELGDALVAIASIDISPWEMRV